MQSSRRKRLSGTFLATALFLVCPVATEAQDAERGLSVLEIGLVGLTVDLRDGQNLGRGRCWVNDPNAVAGNRCQVSLATLREAGVPVSEGPKINLSDGVFGRERFRLAGRITSIDFQGTASSVFYRSQSTVQPPREVYRNEKGQVVGLSAKVSNDIWRNQPVRIPRVRAHVAWTLYDSDASAVIASREIKGLSTDLGGALYDSLERFVDAVSDEVDRPTRD